MTNTSTDIASLADRLEAASGADRELDEKIGMAVGLKRTMRVGHECLGNDREVPVMCPRYTASLDAALTLAPAPMRFMLERRAGGENYRADVWCAGSVPYGSARSWAATPALALCAAAVRSILQEKPHA